MSENRDIVNEVINQFTGKTFQEALREHALTSPVLTHEIIPGLSDKLRGIRLKEMISESWQHQGGDTRMLNRAGALKTDQKQIGKNISRILAQMNTDFTLFCNALDLDPESHRAAEMFDKRL